VSKQLDDMRRIIEMQSAQIRSMQSVFLASGSGSGMASGMGSGGHDVNRAHGEHSGPQYVSIWPDRGQKRERDMEPRMAPATYEYARLVAEASEDERSRRVRMETLRSLQGHGYPAWAWP
jgi:hypothetical protein